MSAGAHGDSSKEGERIAKVMARAGLCSRRDAERWIADRRVKVDGRVIDSPATIVTAASKIVVDGKPLPAAEAPRMWRYHKPDGLVTSHKDEAGRPTVFDRLPDDMPRVISVGRLDLGTEGLLLLTNDGELARALELPSTGWKRRYRVRVHGKPDPARLAALADGITVDGVRYGAIEATVDSQQASNAWLSMGLREGKNREIRVVLNHLGLQVNRLIRVAYGPFQLGGLARGMVKEVNPAVVRQQLGALLPGRLPAKNEGDKAAKSAGGTAKRRASRAAPRKPTKPPSQDRPGHAHRRRKT